MVENYKNTVNKFVIARFFSLAGDAFGFISLSWWILSKSSDKSDLPLLIGTFTMLCCIFLILAGPLGDKYEKRKLMIIGDAICIFAMFAFFLLVRFDQYSFAVVMLLFFIKSIGQSIFSTSSQSIIPSLVPSEKLSEFFSKASVASGLAGIFGGALGGFSVSYLGVKYSLLIDIATYCISIVIIKTLIVEENKNNEKILSIAHWINDIKLGFEYLVKFKMLLFLMIIITLLSFFAAPLPVLLPILVKNDFKMDAFCLGVVEGGFSLGAVLGGIAVLRIVNNKNSIKLVQMSIILIAGVLFIIGFEKNQTTLLLGYFAFGFLISFCNVPLSINIWKNVSKDYVSRIASILMLATKGLSPFAIMIMGVLMGYCSSFDILKVISLGWSSIFLIIMFNRKKIKEF